MKKVLFGVLAFVLCLYVYITQTSQQANASNINHFEPIEANQICENRCNDIYNQCISSSGLRCSTKFEMCLSNC